MSGRASRADGCLRGVYESQSDADRRDHRAGMSVRVGGRGHTEPGELAPSAVTREAPAAAAVLAPPTEAPAGFDLLTNGAVDAARFEAALEEFTGPEGPSEGLGPVFNAAGCAECHATPIIGGSSQVVERRAGRFDGQNFIEHPGGSLIQDRSLFPGLQERVLPGNNVLAFRASLSILGLGFVEAIDSNTIAAIAQSQPSSIRGQLIQVPVLESGGATAGRPFRLEEPAGEPAVVLGRRLLERDGDLDAAAAARAVEQRSGAAGRDGSVPRRARRHRRHDQRGYRAVRRLHAVDQGAAARHRDRRDARFTPRRVAVRLGGLRQLPHADDRHGAGRDA